ncbi:MAG TPA: isocitrate/isopropylmalate family dehydrogenase [Burkholderiales bacterium]|nr:isocitrate/isopropylmalate family dehydrogenase [Burkholderiales bacterium]
MDILIVQGDGIGPEITNATLTAVSALRKKFGLDLRLEHADCGLVSLKKHGVTVRDADIESAKKADGVVLGPMSVREYPAVEKGGVNVPATFRMRLELYANIRPSYVRPGLKATAQKMDLVMVRENLEDFYVDRNMFRGLGEFMPTEEVVIAMGKITAPGSRRIARAACEIAMRRPRKKLTIVHKNPVLKMYHTLFLNESLKVTKEFPQLEVEDLMVDAVTALLIRTPERFDTILTTNMFGDILSDEAAELSGSLGLAASLNRGDRSAVANAGHGSAPDIAGQDVANPGSLMLSTAMLFEHLGATRKNQKMSDAAAAFTRAVDRLLGSPETRTRDLGGKLGTKAFADAVARAVLAEK